MEKKDTANAIVKIVFIIALSMIIIVGIIAYATVKSGRGANFETSTGVNLKTGTVNSGFKLDTTGKSQGNETQEEIIPPTDEETFSKDKTEHKPQNKKSQKMKKDDVDSPPLSSASHE